MCLRTYIHSHTHTHTYKPTPTTPIHTLSPTPHTHTPAPTHTHCNTLQFRCGQSEPDTGPIVPHSQAGRCHKEQSTLEGPCHVCYRPLMQPDPSEGGNTISTLQLWHTNSSVLPTYDYARSVVTINSNAKMVQCALGSKCVDTTMQSLSIKSGKRRLGELNH